MTRKYFIVSLFFLSLFAKSALADNIEFTATAKSNVSVGESFVITYSINVNSGDFQSPPFTGFTVLSGPNQSSSYSTQTYNGRTIQTVNIDVTYILMADEEGTFKIPPATIFVKGKSYKSNSLTINVGKGSGNSKPPSSNQNQRNVPNQNNTTETEGNNNDIYVKAITDKKSASLGEQVILTYKLYTKIPVSQYVINKLSSYTGFWSQDIAGKESKVKQYNEVVNGTTYAVAEIRKVALFPQKSGTLKLEPLEVECLAQIKTKTKDPFANFFNDPFFSNFTNNYFDSYQNVKKTLKSNTVTINVLPLPETNKPNDFSGAVGNYNLNSVIDNSTAKAGDAITLKVTLNGNGNLKLIDKLNINFPPDFEVYDPKIDDKITMGSDGMKGSRTFEYLIIPRNAGQFTINPVSFSYFDLGKKQYVTLTTDSYTLNIAKGSGSETNVTANTVNKEDIKYIGNDIRYIKKNDFTLVKSSAVFFSSMFYWILFLLPIIIFILFVIIWRKKIKENSNIALMKTKKATKVARKRLQTANNYVKTNNSGAFYEEVFKALWGYLSDKLNIPLSDLSKETVSDAMIKIGVTEKTSSRFIETINNCEFARFAPGGNTTASMDSIYSEAAEIITVIEKEINK
jgi:hypothetical protein